VKRIRTKLLSPFHQSSSRKLKRIRKLKRKKKLKKKRKRKKKKRNDVYKGGTLLGVGSKSLQLRLEIW